MEIEFYNGRYYMLENFVDRKTICEKLGISKSSLYRRVKFDGFPQTQMGRRVFYNIEKVNEWLEDNSSMELSHPSFSPNYVE